MSKVYGWFKSDRTKESTKGGNDWVRSDLQTDNRRVSTEISSEGYITVVIMKMDGRNNFERSLVQLVMRPDGTVKLVDMNDTQATVHHVTPAGTKIRPVVD